MYVAAVGGRDVEIGLTPRRIYERTGSVLLCHSNLGVGL